MPNRPCSVAGCGNFSVYRGYCSEHKPIKYESQEAMRHGPRSYTLEQAKFIEETVKARKPLPETPLAQTDGPGWPD